MRNKQLNLLAPDKEKPETKALFGDWQYNLPDEEALAELRRQKSKKAEQQVKILNRE